MMRREFALHYLDELNEITAPKGKPEVKSPEPMSTEAEAKRRDFLWDQVRELEEKTDD